MTPSSQPAARAAAVPTYRIGDDRYCAPCGILFWSVTGADGAAAHRRTDHPEQARFEARSTTQEAPDGRDA